MDNTDKLDALLEELADSEVLEAEMKEYLDANDVEAMMKEFSDANDIEMLKDWNVEFLEVEKRHRHKRH